MLNSFIHLFATLQIPKRTRVGKVWLLFRMVTPDSGSVDELAVEKFAKFTKLLDSLDELLACVCFRRSTEDEDDHARHSQTAMRN